MRHFRSHSLASTVLLIVCLFTTDSRAQQLVTALEEYVYTNDPAYQYALHDTINGPGFTAYILVMDSLRWRDTSQVDRPLWTHQIIVIVPETVSSETALLIVNGGSDPFAAPDNTLLVIAAALADSSESVLAVVSQIPNQPLKFNDDPGFLSEDALVAYSWDKAMDTGDANWAAYLPMTKASVRALDAVESFVNESVTGIHIDDFVVTGFSKRGAVAWLVAAVDPRVRAVAPGVFDVLNIPLQIERHYQAYGFYSSAIEDYVAYDVVRRVRSPEGRFLVSIVDPLNYKRTLHLPKLLLNATGDQFFLPDAANFYYHELPGETLIRQVPNADHGFSNGLFQALDSLLAWYKTTLDSTIRPRIKWKLDDNGVFNVRSKPAALTASIWQVTNPDARDFRLETIGPAWLETVLEPSEPGLYQVTVPTPPKGAYTAYLVTLTFAGGTPQQTYSTPVVVTPDTLPFELNDPVLLPQPDRYWRCQLAVPDSICASPADYTPEQLQALLPLPVFGTYINNLDELTAVLAPSVDSSARARRKCMATRLNIATGQIGWYSQVPSTQAQQPLWEIFALAESNFSSNSPQEASRLCSSLNRL